MTENNYKNICKKIVDSLSGLATGKTCSVLAFIMLVGLLAFSSILAIGCRKQLGSKKAELFRIQLQLDTVKSNCIDHMFDLNNARFKNELLEKQLKSHENDYWDLQELRTKYHRLQIEYVSAFDRATVLESTIKEYERQISHFYQMRELDRKRKQQEDGRELRRTR